MKFRTGSGAQYVLDEETMTLTRLSERPVPGDDTNSLLRGVRVHPGWSVEVGERAFFEAEDFGPLLTTTVVEVTL